MTHTPSVVTAKDTLKIEAGHDVNILGSKASGDRVEVNAGNNLNLASQQDIDNYNEKSSSSGGKIGTAGIGLQGNASKGKIDSNYESVTTQAEIHAGQGGFNIEVGKNTDLKGAVISSDATPDKNKISTDTLSYSDIKNKADYSASSTGVSFDGKLHQNAGIPVSGDADSTTKSAISNGTITVTGNQKQDLSKLNRDPSGVLNALGKIFDKKTVQEKQELTNLFAQEAYKAIGDLALKKQNEAISKAKAAEEAANKGDLKKATQLYEEAKNIASNWQDGGASKIALHAVVGGLIGQISGGNAASEAFSAGTNEASYNSKLIQNLSPELKEFTSIVIGAGVAKLTGGNSKSGASVALSGTKNNNILHDIGWDTLGNLLDETEEVIKEKREAGSQANNDYMKMNTEGYNSTITSEETYGDNISEKQIENAQEIKENIKRVVSTSDDTTKNEVPPPTVDQVLDQGGTWNSAGQLVGSDGTIYENSPNRGDYLYSKGIEPKVNKETNTWYISTADGDCQVYSLGYVGDYYAKKGYPVELGNDGGHYVTAPDGSVWNTSAELTSVVEQTKENYKKTVDENDNLLLLANAGRDAGMGLNKSTTKNIETIIKGQGKVIEVPGRVQSRINLRNGSSAEGAGWEHVVDRHFNPTKNASQFTVTQEELRGILQSESVINTPVTQTLESADGIRYVREINLNKTIGTDKFSEQPTSIMTVLTDKFGNLVTATPGVIK